MQTVKFFRSIAMAVMALSAAGLLPARDIFLGDAPTAPTDLSGLPGGGKSSRSVTGGFTVNIDSREEVRAFYNGVYTSSDGVPMDTTANVPSCTAGTNATLFKEAVLRRINWFRAMAGIPASVTLNAGNNSKDQEAAVMMSANNMLSHTPTNTWFCFTANGANAASNSNLSIGDSGPQSISSYIQDPGTNNAAVGHRRWILYPQTQVMATGDVPEANGFAAANATWIFDANFGGPRPATRKPYVSWPPAGYVPYPVVYPRWSFALADGIFTNALVTMRSNGVSVAVAQEPYQTGAGENTVAWVPMGLNAGDFNTLFPFGTTDTVYSVTVTNIKVGLVTTGYTYTVTLFDPLVTTPNNSPPIITGPSQPSVGQNNAYNFTAVSNATSYQWRYTLRSPLNFFDGAETDLGNFSVSVTSGYPVVISSPVASGSAAFNLQHPTPAGQQTLTWLQTFSPGSNTVLSFKSRLAWATANEYAKVQLSTNSGASWFDIYSQPGSGDSGEVAFTPHTLSLSNWTNRFTQLRFNYYFLTGTYYIPEDPGDGWVIDDITLTNAELWTVLGTNSVATTNFLFNPPQAGSYNLDARALIFTEFPLEWGPIKVVTAVSNTTPVIVLSSPVITSSQVRLDFTVANAPAATFKLLQADQIAGPWTTNLTAVLTTNVPGSSYRFTTPLGPTFRFYRVQTP